MVRSEPQPGKVYPAGKTHLGGLGRRSLVRSTEGLREVASGRGCAEAGRGGQGRTAAGPGTGTSRGSPGCSQGGWGSDAGPQCWGCLEELSKYLLSVPSTGGRELLGLRALISGALAFSLVAASGTEQVTTNMSWLLPKEMSRGGISIKNPP